MSSGFALEDIKKAVRKATGTGEEKLDKLLDDVVARNQRYYTEIVDLAFAFICDTVFNWVPVLVIGYTQPAVGQLPHRWPAISDTIPR